MLLEVEAVITVLVHQHMGGVAVLAAVVTVWQVQALQTLEVVGAEDQETVAVTDSYQDNLVLVVLV
jgi:hypothetical protein